MPGYVNGIPHATSTDRIDLWPTTSRSVAQWIDGNMLRDDDPRLTNARPPTTHTHPIADVTGLAARLAALERDTGWRDITDLLENDWVAEQVLIRRVGPNVYFSHRGLDGRSRTGNTLITLPEAFAPRRALVPFTHLAGVYRGLVNGTGGLEPPSEIRDSSPYTYASAESMWGAPSAAWPSTLPGDPA